MINEEVLQKLRDVHWPSPPSFWPMASGVYVGIGLLIIITLLCVFLIYQLTRKRRFSKILLSEVNKITFEFKESKNIAALQSNASVFIKRVLLAKNKKDLNIENMNLVFKSSDSNQKIIDLLNKDRFKKNPDIDGDLLVKLLQEQVRRCRI